MRLKLCQQTHPLHNNFSVGIIYFQNTKPFISFELLLELHSNFQ